MRRRHPTFDPAFERDGSPFEPIVHLWMLRILVLMGGLRRESYAFPQILKQLGVAPEAFDNSATLDAQARQAAALLKPMWERAERSAHKLAPPEHLVANIAGLAELVHLSPAECRILEFASLLHAMRELDDVADTLGPLSSSKTMGALEKLLGLTEAEVKQALSPKSQLARCGLLTLTRDGNGTLKDKIDLLSENFADAILTPDTEPLSLLRGVVMPSPSPKLQAGDYPHLGLNLQMLQSYLQETQTQRRPGVNVLLYGPPGTGKTAYARWLAQRLNRPLLVKRASDLLSKWLGESEQNIAQAFQEAESDGAVLLIDEVDSFLQERRSATHSWEVTQVNEMLTQMEAYAGVFIATTNLMDGLDGAALRRFDLKAKFDYLLPVQARGLLLRQCKVLGLPDPDPDIQERIGRLSKLTPGDFATVERRHRFHPFTTGAALVSALAAECALKGEQQARIGFLSAH